MSKPIIRIHDVETNEIVDREMTDEEFELYQEESNKSLAEFEAIEAKKVERAQLLNRLGITEDEAKLLLS
jgi:hypothetical protein